MLNVLSWNKITTNYFADVCELEKGQPILHYKNMFLIELHTHT